MKKSLIVITTLALLSVFVMQACNRSSDDLEKAEISVIEAERDLEIAQSEIEAEVRMYRQETANKINKHNAAIAEIKRKIQDEKAEIKAAHEVRIAKLESTNDDLKRQIDNYSISNSDSWDDFKEEFTSSMADLGNSLDNFFTKSATS